MSNAVETITLRVTGMTCGSCERHVREGLGQVPGYRDAKVDLASGRVEVSYEPGAATPEQLVAAVIRAGYPAEIATASAEAPSSAPKSCGCCAPKNA
ncbi:MAG TPA: heavy metal-associated domain-containing protein [Longimicrobiaceae bacterium]|nr:heavy metal-associated domain-containing protein [Longimicrobiaceae bacterium]